MNRIKQIVIINFLVCFMGFSQVGTIKGKIISEANNDPVPFSSIQVIGLEMGSSADENGFFAIKNVPIGSHKLKISSVGYEEHFAEVLVQEEASSYLMVKLKGSKLNLNEVVVTGTRTAKRITDSPVIVNLIDKKGLDQVVALNLSEGLRFQPGLRVETDCQTCNYTQLRMNGLQGGYSQILVNSRPIFSPLTGLYGMEQIPVNMIERIEVVRGGVSALYGSSAIGGTVNVITRIPTENSYSITNTFQAINGKAIDNIVTANATLINEKENAGATFFVNNRNREAYDANGDNFSELSQLKDNSFGTNLLYMPTENQKLSLSFSSIYEYRYGGELVEGPAYLAQQSEERTHHVMMGSMDYQIKFNEGKNDFIVYYGGQNTERDHYTGILPDLPEEITAFKNNPPYGISDVTTHQGGIQLNTRIDDFLKGNAILTLGTEYVYDDVFDEIGAYNYLVDQTTTNLGMLFQFDWDILPSLNLVSGVRMDKHNLLENVIASPRLSLLYKLEDEMQFRLGWGTGFRAPQAFDTDLHIAFAGGGVSRISLSDNLEEERSDSFTASINYDKATEHYIAGITLEAFYTTLENAFFQFPLGQDEFGERFEKRNGRAATVQGITIEGRANLDYIFEVDAGFTIQSSMFKEAVETIEGLPAKREFLRTPNDYGFATLTYTPTKSWSASTNIIYTGSMEIAHFGGENTGQLENEYFSSPAFTEVSLRVGNTFSLKKTNTALELFGGIKNVFNAYQNDFDISKNRDSNYIYGPNLPRTFFVGLRIKSL